MKRAKTLYTAVFEYHKRDGLVTKAGKCRFADGLRSMERTLWYDTKENEYVVMLNGNACPFTPYTRQTSDEYIRGHI
jgi:hypothetical protein